MFLFPEWELVTEPEELPVKEDKPSNSDSLEQAKIKGAGNNNKSSKIWIIQDFWFQ